MLRNRENIEFVAVGGSCKRRKWKASQHEKVEAVLVDWINQYLDEPQPIALSVSIIQKKAREVGKKMNNEFSASNGWLSRFLKKHGVIYRQFCGEVAKVNDDSSCKWVSKILPRYITEYVPRDIFTSTSASYSSSWCLINCTYSEERRVTGCHSGKLSKERVVLIQQLRIVRKS